MLGLIFGQDGLIELACTLRDRLGTLLESEQRGIELGAHGFELGIVLSMCPADGLRELVAKFEVPGVFGLISLLLLADLLIQLADVGRKSGKHPGLVLIRERLLKKSLRRFRP